MVMFFPPVSVAETEPLPVRLSMANYLISYFDPTLALEHNLISGPPLNPELLGQRNALRQRLGELLPQDVGWPAQLLKEMQDIVDVESMLKEGEAQTFADGVIQALDPQGLGAQAAGVTDLVSKGAKLVRLYRYAARNAFAGLEKKKRDEAYHHFSIGSTANLSRLGDIKRELVSIYPNAVALRQVMEPWGVKEKTINDTADVILQTDPSLTRELLDKLAPGDDVPPAPTVTTKDLRREEKEFHRYFASIVDALELVFDEEDALLEEVGKGLKAASDQAYYAYRERHLPKKEEPKKEEPAAGGTGFVI